MPKTKLDKRRDPHEKYRALILGRMATNEMSIHEVARRLGRSVPTVRRYIKDPGKMTLDAIGKLNRILDIDAEAARNALAVK